jgi:hypothetical protein
MSLKAFYGKSPRRILIGLAGLLALAWLTAPGLAAAGMSAMSDADLDQITGHGFSSFTLNHDDVLDLDIARMDLNLRARTFTEIDTLAMGHYDNGSSLGWDQNWNGTALGSAASDISLNGFFLEARFVDVNNAATRQLKSITVGYKDVSGRMTTVLNSFTGTIRGAAYQRQDLGQTTIDFDHEPFSVTIDVEQGITFAIGN